MEFLLDLYSFTINFIFIYSFILFEWDFPTWVLYLFLPLLSPYICPVFPFDMYAYNLLIPFTI